MAIFKHPIPILEHDTNPKALINHDHDGCVLPHRAVFAFLGDTVDQFAAERGAEVLDVSTPLVGIPTSTASSTMGRISACAGLPLAAVQRCS